MTGFIGDVPRRTVLVGLAATVAGCGAQTDGDGGNGADTQTDTPEPKTPPSDAQSTVDDYLADTSNYDGTIIDETGSDAVTVVVGAEGNGGNFAFEPAAILVTPGTTVTWEWTGEGGTHNVVDEGGAFESELVEEADHTFEHTFEDADTFTYFCSPHESVGMKGAVVVVE